MSASRTIRIASRTSKLALWQTNVVKSLLEKSGHRCEILPVESTGDIQLTQPIYALGVTGVFTKQLDAALLEKNADIAVHSLKDVPTQFAEGLFLPAVLERGPVEDVLLLKKRDILENDLAVATIATSSLRRKAQWLAKYPQHSIVPIRGNVQTRLRKFEDSKEMDGVIFAKAGLERLGLLPTDAVVLDWMLPAPAQGIIGIVCRDDDAEMKEVCDGINHQPTFIQAAVERQFMKTLMGGCSVPISALAGINGSELEFQGAMHAYDGKRHFDVHRVMLVSEWTDAGKVSAEKLLQQPGAADLIEEIRNKKWDEKSIVN
jgi:hydroxymethylbilane synthase